MQKAGDDVSEEDDDMEENLPQKKPSAAGRSGWLRLFIIPLLVYVAWLLELFLLVRQGRLFQEPNAVGILLYTFVTCILLGIIIPVMFIRRSFRSGAVNMHQIGFRPAWRIVPVVLPTLILLSIISIIFNPFGTDYSAFLSLFLLVLPTAVASVMICFVLLGTHVQAFMRDGGIIASISTGVIVTSFLYGFSLFARTAGLPSPEGLLFAICTGGLISVFFFAARDVYATIILAAVCLVFGTSGWSGEPAGHVFPASATAACLTLVALVGVHVYFYRKYATVLVRATPSQ